VTDERTRIEFKQKLKFRKLTVKNDLKNNGQKIFEKITVKKYLKNNGQNTRTDRQ